MSTSLSPWDLSGLGMGFGLYRPRRPSYTMATQSRRHRSESYRYATRRDNVEDAEQAEDFIEDVIRRKRQEDDEGMPDRLPEDIELRQVANHNHIEKSSSSKSRNHLDPNFPEKDGSEPIKQISTQELDLPVEPTPCSSEQGSSIPSIILCTFKKNLVILCVSFILIFSSFRAIQNLQSSINADSDLGIITMSCVHGTTFFTSLFTPMVINIFTAKWALCLGMLCYLMWFGGNFYPQFYTLIPTAFFAGFGQGILWTAEISYIVKLAFDSARVTKDLLEHEIFRFHGIFLACFQTTHIWGNLISSLLLSHRPNSGPNEMAQLRMMYPNVTEDKLQAMSEAVNGQQCGVLYVCNQPSISAPMPGTLDSSEAVPAMFEVLWKLMCAYIGLGFIGFLLILVLLDRIGAKAYPDKTGYEILMHHVSQMTSHKTFPLLIPLLIFTGLQQGFMFTDFNRYYVTCALDVEYIGYVMITMGVASILCSILIAVCAHRLRREVVLCFGTILHIALIIGFFIWIPEKEPVLFFVLAAAWGMCDAIWQTQCNTLLCLTCSEEPDVAFANLRLLQSLGLCVAFGTGSFLCVAAKLYLLICTLVVAIMFYVLAEYRIKHGTSSDSVFEEPT